MRRRSGARRGAPFSMVEPTTSTIASGGKTTSFSCGHCERQPSSAGREVTCSGHMIRSRAQVTCESQPSSPYGWLTAVAKDGTANLKKVAPPVKETEDGTAGRVSPTRGRMGVQASKQALTPELQL